MHIVQNDSKATDDDEDDDDRDGNVNVVLFYGIF